MPKEKDEDIWFPYVDRKAKAKVKALQEEIANLKLGIKPKNYWTLAKANQLKEMQEDRINTDFEIQALRKQLVLTQNNYNKSEEENKCLNAGIVTWKELFQERVIQLDKAEKENKDLLNTIKLLQNNLDKLLKENNELKQEIGKAKDLSEC